MLLSFCYVQAQVDLESGLADLDVLWDTGPNWIDLKQRRDQINRQKVVSWNNAEKEVDEQKAVFDIDSNKCDNSVVEQLCCRKRQQDVENEVIQIIDLEQCQDSSLGAIEFSQHSDAALVPSTKQHYETTAKSDFCGSSETSVKMNFEFRIQTGFDSSNKRDSSACSDVIDLCQVEPALEKGSIDAQISMKTMEAAVLEQDEIEMVLRKLAIGVSKSNVDGDDDLREDLQPLDHPELQQEVSMQRPPFFVISQDAVHHQSSVEADSRRAGKSISPTSPREEAIGKALASPRGEEFARRAALQVKNYGIKWRRLQNMTAEWSCDQQKAQTAQMFTRHVLTIKSCLDVDRSRDDWILRWLILSKHPPSRHRSEYSDVWFGCISV